MTKTIAAAAAALFLAGAGPALAAPVLEPTTRAFIDGLAGSPPIYTLAPAAARYPVAIEQDYAVTRYVASHAGEFNADPTRLAVTGDSVGGNMAAVISLLGKERQGPRISAQVLFYPVTDASLNQASYSEFAD